MSIYCSYLGSPNCNFTRIFSLKKLPGPSSTTDSSSAESFRQNIGMWLTDGRTDGRTDAGKSVRCIAHVSRAKMISLYSGRGEQKRRNVHRLNIDN